MASSGEGSYRVSESKVLCLKKYERRQKSHPFNVSSPVPSIAKGGGEHENPVPLILIDFSKLCSLERQP